MRELKKRRGEKIERHEAGTRYSWKSSPAAIHNCTGSHFLLAPRPGYARIYICLGFVAARKRRLEMYFSTKIGLPTPVDGWWSEKSMERLRFCINCSSLNFYIKRSDNKNIVVIFKLVHLDHLLRFFYRKNLKY